MEKMYKWLDDILKNEYKWVNNLKSKDNSSVDIMENRSCNKRVLAKRFDGDCQVYKRLVNLKHENLPVVYEAVYDEQNNKSLVVEEYIDGFSVQEQLEIGLYNQDGVAVIVTQLCDVLKLLHGMGIVHRDIKPSNIMINNYGTVKLIDFDISRMVRENRNKDTIMMGTTGYAAPEQFGIAQTDARTDIFAIGVVINEMLTGKHPSDCMCKGRWGRIVEKCTQTSPANRYRDVGELMEKIML